MEGCANVDVVIEQNVKWKVASQTWAPCNPSSRGKITHYLRKYLSEENL